MGKDIRFVSADEAVKAVKSGDHVHLSSVASAPQVLIEALCRRGEAGELKDVRIHHLHTEGPSKADIPTTFRYSSARPRSSTAAAHCGAMWQ